MGFITILHHHLEEDVLDLFLSILSKSKCIAHGYKSGEGIN